MRCADDDALNRDLIAIFPPFICSQVDSKKELEKRLKAVCESFIMAATKVAVDPMLSFLTKVTAVRVAAQANPAAALPLREQVRCGLSLRVLPSFSL